MKRKWLASLVIVLLCALALAPVLWTVLCSFLPEEVIEGHFAGLMNGSGTWSLPGPGDFGKLTFEQYSAVLLSGPDYLFRFWRSVLLVAPIVIFQILVAVPAAYGFSQTRNKILQKLFFLHVLLFMVPEQVTVIPAYLTARQLKLDNTAWSIWLPGIFSGFSVYLLSRRMSRIPRDVLDAARLDGAGELRLLTRIAIPLSRSEISVCAILLFMDCWNMVEFPVVMFSHPLDYPLSVCLARIQEGAVGISFAAAVIYLVPPVLVFLFGEEFLMGSFDHDNMIC